jgi:hypothetical protein
MAKDCSAAEDCGRKKSSLIFISHSNHLAQAVFAATKSLVGVLQVVRRAADGSR